MALALCALGSLMTPAPAVAQSAASFDLPSSASADRPWLRMNPTTFQLSHSAVLEQYDRVAVYDAVLTPAKRERLAAALEAGEGIEVWVPDGIGLDYLTGRRGGQPHVYEGMVKQIGRSDRALLFDLGDGVYLYWFTGTDESCNNIGVVIVPPEPVAYYAPPPPPIEYVWVMMPEEDLQVFRGQGFIPSVYIQTCCNNPGGYCSGMFASGLMLGGSTIDEDPTMVRVRVARPQS